MFLSKESRQSARILGNVLNFPLYDGDCSPAAREFLAAGNVDGAIAEWRRLADLGSGRARCVLAYLALKGTPSIASDLEEARRLASSALSGERGYANYVLGCIALKEKRTSSVAQYLGESYRAGFLPAATLLAALTLEPASSPTKAKRNAMSVLRRASAAGHRPAQLVLCRAYLRGRLGFVRRFLGVLLLPVAGARLVLSLKYRVFSVNSFYNSNRSGPIFSETRAGGKPSTGAFAGLLSLTHVAAAIFAAGALLTRLHSTSLAWVALAMWPYGLSYLFASQNNSRSLIGTLVQTLVMLLITAFVCDAYFGHLVDFSLTGWMTGAISMVQAFLFVLACAFGVSASKQLEPQTEPAPPYQRAIVLVQSILGLIAAGSVLARPALWQSEYLAHHAFEVSADVLMALLPYVAVGLFSWRLTTTNPWKPWAYVGVLGVGTAVAVVNNSGVFEVQQGMLGVGVVVLAQLTIFYLAAEWALDGDEW